MSSLGQELKRIRELKGYTLEEASSQIEITRQYLSMLEKGQRKSASFEIMNRLAAFYEVPIDYLTKFIAGTAQELSIEEIQLWNTLNKQTEQQVYSRKSNVLTDTMSEMKESV